MHTLFNSKAMTLTEVIVVLVIMGIALFITLPRLSQSKQSGEQSAAKAKAIMLNRAKDSLISVRGINAAENAWAAAANDEARYTLIKDLIPNNPDSTLANFTVDGYLLDFNNDYISMPALLYKDIDLDGVIDSTDPLIGYQ